MLLIYWPPKLRSTAKALLGRRGRSIREHVLSVIPSDVFVAGTLRGNVTEARVDVALRGISALQPFAAASVIPMPRPGDLRRELRKSGHWEDFKIQASKGGSGRFNWADKAHDDPKLWVPIMLSPALGNPLGNTLQERATELAIPRRPYAAAPSAVNQSP